MRRSHFFSSFTMLIFPFLFSILLSFPFASLSLPITSFPTPPGPYNVGITIHELIQTSRIDPFAPCCNQPRRIMISIFHPTPCCQTTPFLYMPAATAAFEDASLISQGFNIRNGSMESLRLQTCPPPSSISESLPLLIFSPGFGVSRLYYSSMMQWIASRGYTIVSIDHPYDADVVEFLDGTLVYGNLSNNPAQVPLGLAFSVRVDDVSFVLDYLGRKKVGMFGHSAGGDTSAQAMLTDKRILGGINFDGIVLGLAMNHSETKPFVLIGQERHNLYNLDYVPYLSQSTWGLFWEELKGPKLLINVNETHHDSFTDIPLILKELNVSVPDNSTLVTSQGSGIGTIDGLRILEILTAYVSAIFEHVLKGRHEPILLLGPSKIFPEVSVTNSSSWE